MKPIKVSHWFDPSRNCYEVYYYRNGRKQKLARAKTEKEGEALERKYQAEINSRGSDTPILTVSQTDEYLRAKLALGSDVPLDVVVREYLERVEKPSIDLETAKNAFLAELEGRGLSAATVRDYRCKLDLLCRTFPKVSVEFFAQPPPPEGHPLLNFIKSVSSNHQTQHHYRANLGTFFSWCESRNWLSTHPKKWIKLGKVRSKTPEVYTPEQAEAIFRQFEAKCPRLLEFLALQAFVGLRPSEAARQTRERIKARQRKITVAHEKNGADKYGTRPIQNPPRNVWAWLKPFVESNGPSTVDSRNYYQTVRIVFRGTDLKLLYDAFRHSCLSYYAVLHGHDKAAELAGHKAGSYTLSRNYKNVFVTKAQAKAYFAIVPRLRRSSQSNTVPKPVRMKPTPIPAGSGLKPAA